MCRIRNTTKQIRGFPNYFITKDGQVYNKEASKWKFISIGKVGYKIVQLWKNNKHYTKYIHRLLLEAFVGFCPKGMECRHLDGDKLNNRLNNLKWGTSSENSCDSIKHGKYVGYGEGKNNPNSKLTKQDVCMIIRLYKEGKHTVKQLAESYNSGTRNIYHIINRQRWKHIQD